MTAYLNCNVTRGQFSGEYAIRGTAQAGEFSLFVPKECVKGINDEWGNVDGEQQALLRVTILKEDEDRALVELPAQTFENGQAVTVQRDQIREVD